MAVQSEQRFHVGQKITVRGQRGFEHNVVVMDVSQAENIGSPRLLVQYEEGGRWHARVCDVIRLSRSPSATYPGGMSGGVPSFNRANIEYVEQANVTDNHCTECNEYESECICEEG